MSNFIFKMSKFSFTISLWCFLAGTLANGQPRKFMLPEALSEVSGLVIAGPDSLWWHNDSGNGSALIRTNARGQIQALLELENIPNRDWEDLTADDQGRIYIGDFGNNANQRQDLRIYRIDLQTKALDSILFTYPDQNAFPPPAQSANFDMEGFFYFNDSLHLFSKNRLHAGNYFTKHYALPASPGVYTAELRDSILLRKRVVTAAAIAPDKQEIALLAYYFKMVLGFIPKTRTSIFFFRDFPGTQFLRGTMTKRRIPHCHLPSQFEALDYLPDSNLIIASERTPLFRAQGKRIQNSRSVSF